jgi:hypothetical protein
MMDGPDVRHLLAFLLKMADAHVVNVGIKPIEIAQYLVVRMVNGIDELRAVKNNQRTSALRCDSPFA